MNKTMTHQNRRSSDMATAETAYRKGLRRRATDRAERAAYYGMLGLMCAIFITIGVLSWLNR